MICDFAFPEKLVGIRGTAQ